MPLTLLDVNSKTNIFIVPTAVDNVYKGSPLLTRLIARNRMRFEGGTAIQQPIMYARLKGGSYGRGQTFDTSYVNTDTALTLRIKNYYVNITLFGTDDVLARGPQAALSLVESKFVNASGAMAENLGTDLFLDGQGTSSSILNLDGLNASIDDATNFASYGDLTRSDIASGANNGINGYYASVPTLSLTALNTAFGAAWINNNHVDLITVTQPVWDIVWNKLQPQQRFQDHESDIAHAGFRSLVFNGATLTVDNYQPAGTIYGINTEYMQFWITTLQKKQFGFTGFKEAQNSDDVAGQYLFAGNLVNSAPRLMFRIDGITG